MKKKTYPETEHSDDGKEFTWTTGNTFALVTGVILYSSAIEVATKLNPLKSWWAFALAGKPGESNI